MAELDNIPQKQTIEIAQVKLEESVVKSLTELNQKSGLLISDFGQIYIRRKELQDELKRLDEVCEIAENDFKAVNLEMKDILEALDEILEVSENDFKAVNLEMKDILEALDEKYPQGRVNLQEGTVTYQPGALTRKQLAEQQSQGAPSMKVVKE